MPTFTWSTGTLNYFSWTVPAGQQVNTIKCWGAGSGGGSPNTGNGNGGGGGGYSEKDGLTIAAGTVLNLRVGPGGLGSDSDSNPAVDGGQTYVISGTPSNNYNPAANSCICRAIGATNGDSSGTGSGGDEGTFGHAGGNGGPGGGNGGPGGGSSAGPASAGNNGGAATGPGETAGGPGGAAVTGGGAGGSGANEGGEAFDGSAPGGGGGASDGDGSYPAGNGADGQIIIITSAVFNPAKRRKALLVRI